MSTVDQPAPANTFGTAKRVLFGVLGIVAIVVGVRQMTQGFNTFFGGHSAEFNQLLADSDKAFAAAVESAKSADALFAELLTAVDNESLATVRADRRGKADEATKNYLESAKQFRLSADKLEAALARNEHDEQSKKFLDHRTRAARLLADVCDQNREIVAAVFDDSIASTPDVVAKVFELAKSRDATQKEAETELTEAAKLVEEKGKTEETDKTEEKPAAG